MTTTNDDLVRYISGRLRWISPAGVEDVFKSAREFASAEFGHRQTHSIATKKENTIDREKAVKQQMGFS